MFGTHCLKNGWRYKLDYNRAFIGNDTWGIWWSRDWWRHVTRKVNIVASICLGWLSRKRLEIHAQLWLHVILNVKVMQIYLDGNILNSVIGSIGQTPCSLKIILFNVFFPTSCKRHSWNFYTWFACLSDHGRLWLSLISHEINYVQETSSLTSFPVFTARCTLVQSAVLRSHVVCLSVCLSVCL